MATAKKSTPTTTAPEKTTSQSVADNASNIAQAGFDRVKEAIPSMEGVASEVQDYVQDHANVDLQRMADDATNFVRRNPATSLAAAAGVGVLIGILAAKRS